MAATVLMVEERCLGTFAAQEACATSTGPCPKRPRPDCLAPALVGDIVGQHGTVTCLGSTMLPDVADLLIAGDRSAATVVDDAGNLLGVITENDMVQAYVEGTEWNYMVPASVWLQSGRARLPSSLAQALTVKTTTPLLDAAGMLRVQAAQGTACRHLVVRDESESLCGVLSALDLARAVCSVGKATEEADQRIGLASVAEVMKPRAALPSCQSMSSMGKALRAMIDARQNCVLVVDMEAADPGMVGIITPRDALRAFAEHVRLDVAVGHWLRGLRSGILPRVVSSDAGICEAAQVMAINSIHHLLAVSPTTGEVIGVLSTSDLAHAMGSAERVVTGCEPCDI
mmetsp:Transcript_89261/g.207723  ORF Transcript_89261/g.207723 Transcript_89261/m.207723 type:complete len:343 (+) Transcript_89261:49-1077(+)